MILLKHKRKIFIVSLLLLIFLSVTIVVVDRIIENAAKGKLYSATGSIPYNKVGLLLGTGKFLSNGAVNPYYQYRVDAAIALLKSGKIKYIVVSGDNSRKEMMNLL